MNHFHASVEKISSICCILEWLCGQEIHTRMVGMSHATHVSATRMIACMLCPFGRDTDNEKPLFHADSNSAIKVTNSYSESDEALMALG